MKSLFVIGFILTFNIAEAAKPAPGINPFIRRSQKIMTDSTLFEGIVKLSNCSGSLVSFKGMPKTKKALVMTNGHCHGFDHMGEVIVNQPTAKQFSVFDGNMKLHPLTATKIVYATMTYTDVTFYETTLSYKEIEDQFDVEALVIDDELTRVGQAIDVVSGYWEIFTSCTAEAIVPRLKEGIWLWTDSVRYSAECKTKGGYSGSPVIAKGSKSVVAIHNTGHNGKFDCSDNNPCEQDELGQIVFRVPGRRYAQQVHQFYGCLNANFDIDVTVAGCELPKP